jgi:hypothetical protein
VRAPCDPPLAGPPSAPLSGRAILGVLLVAALLGLAELPFAALMADDLMQLGALEGVLPSSAWTGPLDLYTISDGDPEHVRAMQDAGAFPWFFGPAFEMAFLRPVSSALVALDHATWELWPPGHRLHGGLWLLALVAGFGLVVRRALPSGLASLALVVFAVSAIHGSLFWNATRHVVVAGALGVLALAAHLEWREAGWRAGHLLSIAGFALALAASEAALSVIAYLVAYEALGAGGRAGERLRAAAPALLLTAAYVALYLALGLGAAGGGYADPLRDPGEVLVEIPRRWLVLLGGLVAGGGADLWVLRPDLRAALTLLAAVLVLGAALLLRATWRGACDPERRGARWLVAGAAASAPPFAAAPIGSRCLVLPMLGGSVAIAFVLRGFGRPAARGGASRLVAGGIVVLAAIHLVLAPLGRLAAPVVLRRALHDDLAAAMRDAELDPAALETQRVIVLRAPDFVVGLHGYFHRALYRMPMPRSWRTLSWAPCAHLLERTGPRTFEVATQGCEIEAPALGAGDVVALDGMRITVLARGPLGPRRVAVELDRPLEDPSLRLLAWQAGRLRRVAPPPIGGGASF